MSALNHFDDRADEPVRQFTRLAAAGLLAAAGGLHLAALPGQLNASTVAGAFFAVTAAAQLLGAVVLATRPSSRTILAVISGNVAVLTLWVLSRTAGLPTGGELGLREPFGLLDGFAAAAELLVVVAGLATLVRPATRTRTRSGDWRLGLALALTWVVSGGAGLAVAHDGHHHVGGQDHHAPAAGGHGHQQPDLGQPPFPEPRPDGFDLSEPVRISNGNVPAGNGHSHDTPALSQPATRASCPAGHDCTDHSH